MRNSITLFYNLFLAGTVFAMLCTGCKQPVFEIQGKGGTSSRVLLTEIKLHDYILTPDELSAAAGEGFSKIFSSDVESIIVMVKAEDGASVKIEPAVKIALEEKVKPLTITVTKPGKETGIYRLNISKEKAPGEAYLPSLADFKATNFEGAFATDVPYYVINSTLAWHPFSGAAYYNVFIDGKRTNDPADGNLTKTKFKTAEGIIDLDKEMDENEKEIKISVKAYDYAGKVIAESYAVKTLPRKNKIGKITINGKNFGENMEVSNPIEIKIELNNSFKFIDENIDKGLQNCRNYIQLTYYDDSRPCDFSYSSTENSIIVNPLGGLKEKAIYKLVIKKGFKDKHNLDYTNKDLSYQFKIMASENPAKPDVEKILINDDTLSDIKKGEKSGINVESSISIYFNQLIDVSSFTPALAGDDGSKGIGIFITEKVSGKGTDSSRLIDAKFETIMLGSSKPVTKLSFKMVGKAGFFSSEPLKGNTDYWICFEDNLKTAAGAKFKNQRFKFSTGKEKPVLYTLEVKDGIIVGNTEEPFNVAHIKEGENVTIKAVVPVGKVFSHWHVGDYFKPELTEEEKHSNPLTFKMKGEDVHFTAHFRNPTQ